MADSIGRNEALILTALTFSEESTIAAIAERIIKVRDIDHGTIYLALRRMVERGLVVIRKEHAKSRDGKTREIGFYQITSEGRASCREYELAAQEPQRLRVSFGGATA